MRRVRACPCYVGAGSFRADGHACHTGVLRRGHLDSDWLRGWSRRCPRSTGPPRRTASARRPSGWRASAELGAATPGSRPRRAMGPTGGRSASPPARASRPARRAARPPRARRALAGADRRGRRRRLPPGDRRLPPCSRSAARPPSSPSSGPRTPSARWCSWPITTPPTPACCFTPRSRRRSSARFPWLLERDRHQPGPDGAPWSRPALVARRGADGTPALTKAGTVLAALAAAVSPTSALRDAVPGANDNATGVAALLAMARALADDPPRAPG